MMEQGVFQLPFRRRPKMSHFLYSGCEVVYRTGHCIGVLKEFIEMFVASL